MGQTLLFIDDFSPATLQHRTSMQGISLGMGIVKDGHQAGGLRSRNPIAALDKRRRFVGTS